jgi:murein DD-endopeptidase MepM/ murein hydrolase activator NlpD
MPFGNPNTYAGHSGVDYPQSTGTLVRASEPFTVVRRGWLNNAAGNGIQIRYNNRNGLEVLYCHFNNQNYIPQIGGGGDKGSVLGSVGTTGNSTGPHCHMQIMVGKGASTYAGIWNYFDRGAVVNQEPAYTPPTPDIVPEEMLGWTWNGVQLMLRRYYGYGGAIDNNPGKGTITAFQRFINANRYRRLAEDGAFGAETCRGAQSWLKVKWGYAGAIDALPGNGTKTSWDKAEKANRDAFG